MFGHGLDPPPYTDAEAEAAAEEVLDGVMLRDPVTERWDPTIGLPADPEVGDRYIATDTDEGWTEGDVYEWDGDEWIEEEPADGWMIWVLLEMMYYIFFSGAWKIVAHHSTHEYQGADEINVGGLSGLLADPQHVIASEVVTIAEGILYGTSNSYADPLGVAVAVSMDFQEYNTLYLTATTGGGPLTHTAAFPAGRRANDRIELAGAPQTGGADVLTIGAAIPNVLVNGGASFNLGGGRRIIFAWNAEATRWEETSRSANA